jgi:hypothetical protein
MMVFKEAKSSFEGQSKWNNLQIHDWGISLSGLFLKGKVFNLYCTFNISCSFDYIPQKATQRERRPIGIDLVGRLLIL